jgi:hypothetical protein
MDVLEFVNILEKTIDIRVKMENDKARSDYRSFLHKQHEYKKIKDDLIKILYSLRHEKS